MRACCRICKGDLYVVWNLLDAPYGDLFQDTIIKAKAIKLSAITLARCKNCSLLQLQEITNIDEQYKNYLYLTKNTNKLSEFYTDIAEQLINQYKIDQNQLVLDIGSNDGTFLNNFKLKNFSVLGIDPSIPAAAKAQQNEIKTITGYFTSNLIKEYSLAELNFSVISINYTLANVPDVDDFMNNVSKLMNNQTVLSIVTGYHPDQFSVNMFDYIGHDHLSYFTLQDFETLSQRHGLKILDVVRREHKGGSIHVLLSKRGSTYQQKSAVSQNLQRETWMDVTSDIAIFEMVKNISLSKVAVKNYVTTQKLGNFFGIGASISTSHLINQFEIARYLKFLFDDDVNKINRFSPYNGIEVKPLSQILNFGPATIIILAWQHVDKIVDRLIETGYRGIVLIPLPKFKIFHLDG